MRGSVLTSSFENTTCFWTRYMVKHIPRIYIEFFYLVAWCVWEGSNIFVTETFLSFVIPDSLFVQMKVHWSLRFCLIKNYLVRLESLNKPHDHTWSSSWLGNLQHSVKSACYRHVQLASFRHLSICYMVCTLIYQEATNRCILPTQRPCFMLKLAVKFGFVSDLLYIALYFYKKFRHRESLSVIGMTKVK